MMFKPINRRTLLRGAGGIALALPFLEAMEAKAGGERPPRFIVFFSGNGTIPGRWEPVGSGTDYVLDDPSDPGRHLAPLEPWKDDLIVLDGIDQLSRLSPDGLQANLHDMGMAHMLTGAGIAGSYEEGNFGHLLEATAGGPSIDQVIADSIGGDTPFRSVQLGIRALLDPARPLTSRMIYRAPFEVLVPENDPRAAFDTLFAGANGTPADLAELRARRQSVLDKVKDDFDKLNARLGSADRIKLEGHLDAIREVETTLDSGEVLGDCTIPNAPEISSPTAGANFPIVGKVQMELLALAMACDLTRVGSLQWHAAQGYTLFSWVNAVAGHHDLSHEYPHQQNHRESFEAVARWYAEQYAYLLQLLADQDDGGSRLLDNTVVLWCNECGEGNEHSLRGVPYVVGGNYNNNFASGRALRFTEDTPHNDLYVSIANGLGVDINTFGDPNFSTGPLPGVLA